MKRNIRTLVFSTLFSVMSLSAYSTSSVAAPSAINIHNILQQERAWAGLQTKRIKVTDVDWAYSEGGTKGKPTLVLVHGLAGSRDNWNRVARYLTDNYHVIVPDLPGQGDSKVAANFDYSIPNLTEKLRRFLEAIEADKDVHIAGHSMGGAIAMLYTAQYPIDTKSVFLINSAGVYKTIDIPYIKNPELLKDFIVSKPGDFERLLKIAANQPPFIPNELKVEQEKLMIANATNTTKLVEQLIQMAKIYTPESFAIATRSIDQPALILWGEKDKILDKGAATELKSLLKNAEPPIILKNVGHLPLLEQEQVLVQHYLAFLSKLK